MKKLVLLLAGASLSLAATAQSGTSETVIAGSSVTTTALTIAAPLVLLVAVTVAAEENDTPSAPATTPSATSTR